MTELAWLDPSSDFPPTHSALSDPNGLLAVGGDLSTKRLVDAYTRGIFPWFSEGQPILWWTPSPRMVLNPQDLYINRSTRKFIKNTNLSVSGDLDFDAVMERCATVPRAGQEGSWITQEMLEAYQTLHQQHLAHSVEVWQDDELVGGLYGVAIGRVFFGESMFSLVSGASKLAFVTLAKNLQAWGYGLIDCQIHTDYLASFGAKEITREDFEQRLNALVTLAPRRRWQHGTW